MRVVIILGSFLILSACCQFFDLLFRPSSGLKEANKELAREVQTVKAAHAQESEDHDRLRLAVAPLRDSLGIAAPGNVDELIEGVEAMPARIQQVAVASLRYGIRQTLAIARSHYDDIKLDVISQGFPRDYNDEALDAFEQEAAPLADTMAKEMQLDDEFPFKPVR